MSLTEVECDEILECFSDFLEAVALSETDTTFLDRLQSTALIKLSGVALITYVKSLVPTLDQRLQQDVPCLDLTKDEFATE